MLQKTNFIYKYISTVYIEKGTVYGVFAWDSFTYDQPAYDTLNHLKKLAKYMPQTMCIFAPKSIRDLLTEQAVGAREAAQNNVTN